MNHAQATLQAFLQEKLEKHGIHLDPESLNLLNEAIVLEEGRPNEAIESRPVYMREESDGTPTAKSISLYNLLRISFHDVLGVLLKIAGIAASAPGKLGAALSLLELLHDFYPKLTFEFKEKDAKVLLAIFRTSDSDFSKEAVLEAYQAEFNVPLDPAQAERSLSFFQTLKIIDLQDDGLYSLRQRMEYDREF
jgi:hypothetical protein